MDILGVSGTPRRNGNSDAMVEAVLEGARSHGMQTRMVKLREYDFRSCVGCERCRKDNACTQLSDGMQLIYPLFEEARGLVLVSPVHTYNMSALMKAFIDRLYCYYDFEDGVPRAWSSRLAGQRRKAVIACVAEQFEKENLGVTMPALRLPLESLGYQIVGEHSVLGLFPAGKVRSQQNSLNRCAELGAALAGALGGSA
ncbi:flavodoxin family protein [Oceanidesulfovibrio indonesiensis]|uniref:Flavodoxin family protein n=1 Tax=Oceanidesulfovibrio indonesiensis TaxID=54767 RepID=A0A7M3MGT4_9BACT|nr:NAD(P)H-dependent oxidoreductase [Oceanidesulfovibrio indonesiensis]TVM18679.1 flavodoxin family protein [Oceanidesulfovibrio indonesiensis]